jgi:hypothetical protein
MRDVDAAQMAELNPCALCPQALARIAFGGLGRQTLHVQPLGCPIRQEGLHHPAAVHGGAIPHDAQAAGPLAQQLCPKGDHIGRVHRVVLRMEVACALGREGADRRQMLTGIPLAQNGRLAHRGLRAHDTGQRRTPGLV